VRQPAITDEQTLSDRQRTPEQVPGNAPEVALPPYLESLLAHMRLLIGVPFDYLVPDERLLPVESIRFFYLDRSWSDRLVDGVFSVGKIGTRERAHHQAHDADIRSRLDQVERSVRDLQRGRSDSATAPEATAPAEVVTGFVMRSSVVSGWPHMDVRAFDEVTDPPVDSSWAAAHQLQTLRLERLSPSVMIGLFQGTPKLVWFEEPHHGVQLGVYGHQDGSCFLYHRADTGQSDGTTVDVPLRATGRRVVDVSSLARRLGTTSSAELAVQLLHPPWRQRLQGGLPDPAGRASGFVAQVPMAEASGQLDVQAVRRLMEIKPR
jgi:hypothetical protein